MRVSRKKRTGPTAPEVDQPEPSPDETLAVTRWVTTRPVYSTSGPNRVPVSLPRVRCLEVTRDGDEADDRLLSLRTALERARARVDACRAELERFDHGADTSDPAMARHRAKLAEDLSKAEDDAAWAEIALADATAPTEAL